MKAYVMLWLCSSADVGTLPDLKWSSLQQKTVAFFYISSTFFKILVVPSKAVFCITPTLFVIPSSAIHPSNYFVALPRAPITIGKTFTVLSFHNLPSSLFIFLLSFSSTLKSASTAISMIIPLRSFLSIKMMFGLLASSTLSH